MKIYHINSDVNGEIEFNTSTEAAEYLIARNVDLDSVYVKGVLGTLRNFESATQAANRWGNIATVFAIINLVSIFLNIAGYLNWI